MRARKIKGRKRFLVTDALGLLVAIDVVAAGVQDRDGAKRPLLWTRLDHPQIRKIWEDQDFAGRLVDWTTQVLDRELDIVRKDPGQCGFQVQPKRWAIERTFWWLTAHPGLRDQPGPPTVRRLQSNPYTTSLDATHCRCASTPTSSDG